MEKRVERANEEMAAIKADFSPQALGFAKAVMEEKMVDKELSRLVSGKGSIADTLHTHIHFPNDVMFEKDVLVKGERAYVRRLPDNREMVSFAQESARAMISEAGIEELAHGEARIALDPQFLELITDREDMPFLIQLTPAGECNGLYVSRQTETGFTVRELGKGTSHTPFYWRVEAVRRGFEDLKHLTPQEYQAIKAARTTR